MNIQNNYLSYTDNLVNKEELFYTGSLINLEEAPSENLRVQVQPENEESISVRGLAKAFFKAVAICELDINLSHKIADLATNKLGFCLDNFISENGKTSIGKFISPIAILNKKIGDLFGSSLSGQVFVPAICEEVEFRWFVQEILLRQLPKQIVKQISPDLMNMVDSTPAKISRVAATALIFAYCHTYALNCTDGGGVYQLVGGAIYGTLYEFNNYSLFDCMNLHFIYNVLR